MGNRAIVAFAEPDRLPDVGVYLHWNGGPESIYCFLDAMRELGWRFDGSYGPARLAQLAGQFFGSDGLSVGVYAFPGGTLAERAAAADPGDNGVYVVNGTGKNFTMRRFSGGREWTGKQVAAEHTEAMQSNYRTPTDGTPGMVEQLVALARLGDRKKVTA